MIDITSINTFNSLSELLPLISELNKDKNKYFPPMIFISNKTDLDSSREVSGFEIKELVDKYPGMLSVELSLLERDSFNEFMKQFVNTLKKEEQKNIYDFLHLVKIQDPPLLPGKKEEENTNDNDLSLNLFLLGSSGVGKTTFIKKFLKFNFFENSLSTLGIDVEKTLAKVGENFVKIELWDTAGQERLRSIPKRYYSKGDGFLLLYDVCSKSSFEDVSGWIKDIREARGTTGINGINDKNNSSNEVLFLIGNKIDNIKKREVKKEDAKKMAEEYGVSYFEISCKDGVNVYEILSNLIFEAFSRAKGTNKNFKLNNQNTQKAKKKKCC
jgi:small GTP-binding protein